MTARNAFGNLQLDATGQQIDADVKANTTAVTAALATLASQGTAQAVLDVLTAAQNPTKQALVVSGVRDKFRDGFTTGTVAAPVDPAVWKLVNEAPDSGDGTGHIVIPGGDSQGAAYLRVSLSPFSAGTSVHLVSRDKFALPIRHAWGVSMSQRSLGQEVIFGLGEGLDSDPTLGLNRLPQPADLPIVGTVTTTGSLATITVNNHGLKGNDRVVLIGNTEKRLDIGPVYVTVVDANTFTVPTTVGASTFPAGGVVRLADPTAQLNNAAVQLWGDNATVTNATYAARRNGTKARMLTAQGSNSSTPTQANTSPYSDAWLAVGPAEIWANIDEVAWRSWSDGNGGPSGYNKIQQSIPDETLSYRLYCRAKNLDNLSRPIARIVSAVKTGATTSTFTTDVPHGLVASDQLSITGIRNQTDFPTTGTQVTTVVSPTVFTAPVGPATTATDTLGGTVWLNRGGVSSPGLLGQVPSSLTKTGSILTVVGQATWSGVNPGDYVNLHGSITTPAGNFDGAYKVLRTVGATLELAYTGTLPDQASFNTGGTVLKRTDVRLHFARILAHTRLMTEVVGGRGSNADNNNAVPVSLTSGSATISINSPLMFTSAAEFAPLSVANLLASGVFTQPTVDTSVNANARYGAVRVLVGHVAANTHGYLTLEQSTDNTTFRETHRVPVPSDFVTALHSFDFPLMQRYWRVKFTNGAVAQTAFYLAASGLRVEPLRDTAKSLVFPLTAAAGGALSASQSNIFPTLDLGQNNSWNTVRLWSYADVAGTVFIDESLDGSTWRTVGLGTTINAGSAIRVEQQIATRYLRVRYVNGATAATAVTVAATLISL